MSVTRSNRIARLDSDLVLAHSARILETFGNVHRKDARKDAGETAAFARELEHILVKAYEVKYPEVKWRSLFPINTETPSGAETFSENTFDEMGEALFGDPDADNFPLVEVKGTNSAGRIKSILSGYQYSIQDIRASALMGRPLDAMRARAARRIIERRLDTVMFNGDTAQGYTGLAGVGTAVTVGAKGGANQTWVTTDNTGGSTTLGQYISDDVHKLAKQIFTDTKSVYGERLTLVVGSGGWATLAQPRTFGNQPTTIGKFLLAMHPWLEAIEFSPRLDTAGAGTKERIVAYVRDPEVLEAMISQDFEQFAPQARNLKFVVPCHVRTGGLLVHVPKAVAYMDGTQP